jgi:hypothetical protein
LYNYVAAGGPLGPSNPNGTPMYGRYHTLLYKRVSSDPSADWQFQVIYSPARIYLFKRDDVVGMFTNALYEFLSDRKWGAARVTASPRTPVVAAQDGSTGDAASQQPHR